VLNDQNRNIHLLGQHPQDLVDFVDLGVDEPAAGSSIKRTWAGASADTPSSACAAQRSSG